MRITVNPTINRLLIAAAVAGSALLAGCAANQAQSNALYDFGAPSNPVAAGAVPLAALVVTDVTGPAALDNERMFYRLNYSNPLQARAYANSRWNATPLQMITQRVKSRVAQSGVKVLSATDASSGVPLLRIEVDDFTHTFDSPSQSHGEVVLRASLFEGHKLVDQKTFSRRTGSASADAAGGSLALAASTDAVAADILAWLARLRLRKE
jgi:cholesterol transport system auxiliary component